MDNLEFVKSIAKRCNAEAIVKRPDWDKKEVWEMLFYDPDEEKIPLVGIPQFIILTGNESFHLTDDEEAMKYMDYLSGEEPDDTEEAIKI